MITWVERGGLPSQLAFSLQFLEGVAMYCLYFSIALSWIMTLHTGLFLHMLEKPL